MSNDFDPSTFNPLSLEGWLLYEAAFLPALEIDESQWSHALVSGNELAAVTLLEIGLKFELTRLQSAVLRDLYDALVLGKKGYRLRLGHARRGKPITDADKRQLQLDDEDLRLQLDLLSAEYGSRESAVAALSEKYAISRATVFAKVKRSKKREKSQASYDEVRQMAEDFRKESSQKQD